MPGLVFHIDADYQKVIRLREEIEKLKSTLSGMDGNTSPATLRAMEVQLAKNTKELDTLIVTAVKVGNEMDQNFKKKIFDSSMTVNRLSEDILNTKEKIDEYAISVRRLSEYYKTLSKSSPNFNTIGTELADARKNLEAQRDRLRDLQIEQGRARLSVKSLKDEYTLFRKEGTGTVDVTRQIEAAMGNMAKKVFSAVAIKEFVSQVVDVRAEMQSLNKSFEVLLGSKEKSDAYVKDIKDYALVSPLSVSDVSKAAQTLLGFNVEAEKTIPIIKSIGDISMGDSQKFGSLTLAFAQMSAAGRLMGQDLNQMINAGFNPLQVISEKTGKSIAQLKKDMESGAVSSQMVADAFASATAEGGKFYGMTEKSAEGIRTVQNQLTGAIEDTFNAIGESHEGIIKGSYEVATYLVKNYDTVGRVLVSLVGTYGAYRAAVITNIALTRSWAVATRADATAKGLQTVVTKAATIVTAAYNAVLKANPYVMVTTLVVGLATAMWALHDRTSAAEKAQKRFNDEQDKFTQKEKDRKQKVEELIRVIQDETETELEKIKAYEELERYSPALTSAYKLEELATLDLAKSQKILNEERDKADYDNLIKKSEESLKRLQALRSENGKLLGISPSTGIPLTVNNDAAIKAEQELLKKYQKSIDDIQKKKNELNSGNTGKKALSSVSDEIKTVATNIATLKQELSDLRSGKTSAEAGKTVQSAIEDKTKELKAAEDALSTLTGKDKSSLKEASDLLKLQSELSRSILDSELKLQSGRIAAMEDGKAKRIALTEQETKDTIAAIQKEKAEYQTKVKESKEKVDPTVIKTFDNRELAAKEKEKADIARIEKEYAEEYKQRTKALTDVFLNEEERKLSSIKERYTQEKKWADEQLKTGGMTKEEHTSYSVNINKAQQQETYRSLLDNLNDYKQQEKDLRDKWDTDIAVAAEAKDAYLVAKLMEGKQKALSALNGQMLQETNEWQQLFGDLDNLTVTQIDNLISIIEDKAKDLKLNPVDLREVTNSLNQAKQKVIELNPFKSLGDSIKTVFSSSSKDSKQSSEDIKKNWNNMAKSTEGCFEFVNDAVSSCDVLKDIIGESGQEIIGMIQGVAVAGIAMATAIKTAETASVVLAAISLALQAVTTLFSLFNGDKKHEKKIKDLQGQVENLEKAYDRLGRTIENTYSNEVYSLMDQQEAALRRQQALIRQQIREEEAKKKTDKDKVNEYKDKLEELDNQIEDSNRKQIEMWAGTDIQTAIDDFADALIEAYAQGEDGAKAMGDTTKKILANAVKEALKKQLLGKALQGAVTQLGKDMEDGQLSDSDRKRFEDSANAAGKRFTEAMKVYDDLFKDTENQLKDGVSGQLQAATTEGTASQLVGLWNSTAIDMRELKNLSMEQRDSVRSVMDDVREIVKQNYLIEQNTRRGADNTDGLIDELRDGFNTLDKRLGTIEKNTKSYNGRG